MKTELYIKTIASGTTGMLGVTIVTGKIERTETMMYDGHLRTKDGNVVLHVDHQPELYALIWGLTMTDDNNVTVYTHSSSVATWINERQAPAQYTLLFNRFLQICKNVTAVQVDFGRCKHMNKLRDTLIDNLYNNERKAIL